MDRPPRSTVVTLVAVALAVVLALVVLSVVFGQSGPVEEPGSVGEPGSSEGPGSSDESRLPTAGAAGAAVTPAVDEIPDGGIGRNFEVVAHESLLDDHQYVGNESYGIPRGSNGEITVAGDCLYVGSLIGHQPPLIVDVEDPTDPTVVGPVPDAVPGVGNGIEGIEASGDVLVIQHRSGQGGLRFEVPEGMPKRGFSVWDVSDCRNPELVARHDSGDLDTHALRLWRDPQDPDRLLAVQTFLDTPNVQVVDLTDCPDGSCEPEVVAEWTLGNQTGLDSSSHEAIFSTDGRRLYVAQADPGFLLLDSSNLVASLRGESDCDPSPPDDPESEDHCLTVANPDVAESLDRQPEFESGFPHTLAKVPDRPYFLASGESSGPDWSANTTAERFGKCPGATLRVHTVERNLTDDRGGNGSDAGQIGGPLDPEPVGEFRLPEQRAENCGPDGWKDGAVPAPGWLSPHFPLAFHDVAFVTYYGGGVRAINISDPTDPQEVGYFFNDPVEDIRWTYHGAPSDHVTNDDGETIRVPPPNTTHPFAFSYPVVVDGYLVYSDAQSGIYVLEYTGPHAEQIPDEGTCLPSNAGAAEPGYDPCPPYGQTDWTAD